MSRDEEVLTAAQMRLVRYMQQTIRRSVVRKLLHASGQFTTAQYQEAYVNKIQGMVSTYQSSPGEVERHLESLADLIVEVMPGIWQERGCVNNASGVD